MNRIFKLLKLILSICLGILIILMIIILSLLILGVKFSFSESFQLLGLLLIISLMLGWEFRDIDLFSKFG